MPLERMDGPELIDERLAYLDSARSEQAAKGEHGLAHLRRALDGIVVPNERHAESLIEELCHMRGIRGGGQDDSHHGVRVEFWQGRKRKRGHYNKAFELIVLNGVPRLATLLHEWAHHAVGCRYVHVRQAHGREFKAELRWAYKAIQSVTGLKLDVRQATRELSKEAAEVPTFRAGDRVMVRGRGPGKVERKMRTRYLVTMEHQADWRTIQRYRCPPQALKKLS